MGQIMMNVAPKGGSSATGSDPGFEGAVVIHKFSPEEMPLWSGLDGIGLPEGIWDRVEEKLWV